MFSFKKEKINTYVNRDKPKDPKLWDKWWNGRWENLDLNCLGGLGFKLPEIYLNILLSSREHQLRNLFDREKSPIYVQPLDLENFKETSKVNGFLSITIGEFPHGESAVISLSGPEGKIFLMDDLGGGAQICDIVTYEEFFSWFK